MPPRPIETSFRLLAALAVLLLLAGGFGNDIATPLLPLFGHEIEIVVPQLRVLAIELNRTGADSVVVVHVGPAPVVLVADQLLPLAPQTRFHVSTLAGHVLQPAALFLAALIAWPSPSRRRHFLRLLAGLALLAPLIMIDVPFVLAAELHASLLDIAAPGTTSILLAWKEFLEAGGRVALAILTAAGVLAWFEGRPSKDADDPNEAVRKKEMTNTGNNQATSGG